MSSGWFSKLQLINKFYLLGLFPQVYEALIEDKGKNFIFIRLSKACVDELGLSCDQEFTAQVRKTCLLSRYFLLQISLKVFI